MCSNFKVEKWELRDRKQGTWVTWLGHDSAGIPPWVSPQSRGVVWQNLRAPTGSLFSPALGELLPLLSLVHSTNTNLHHTYQTLGELWDELGIAAGVQGTHSPPGEEHTQAEHSQGEANRMISIGTLEMLCGKDGSETLFLSFYLHLTPCFLIFPAFTLILK